jgi:predicted N-acetyltransferase YhbS
VTPDGITLRRMTPDDVPAALALCRASRWNQTARDWEQFLALEPEGATVAVRDGRVIGTVATVHSGMRFGWIAMVLVDPAERKQGLGRALLLHGLHALSDVVARLDATPAGEVLYRKLDFELEYRLTRMQRDPAPWAASGGVDRTPDAVTPIDAPDWPAILALDERAFGANRSRMLRWLADGAPEYAWVYRSPQGVDGFALGRHGHDFEHLGPIVATRLDVAQALVAACLARQPDRRFILDAPDDQPSWQAWLRDAGFAPQRPFARMYRGVLTHHGRPDLTFASIGPEFG